MTHPTYLVADLFCGAGGSSSGARRALRAAGADMDLVAVNHWPVAVATHQLNHPDAWHHCVDLDAARPEALVPEGRLDLLMASPECVHFSRARGGRPVHDQRRMSAWHVQRWASALDVRTILVENVAEFREWGPLLPSGKPDPAGKGLYFQAWIQALWAMGYVVDWRLLNAADFGDATTRTRFFLQARKDGQAIRWPEPSHSRAGAADLLGHLPRWRAARDVIDWDRPGGSLLERRRPLSVKTRIRIARGLERFGGPLAPLFVALLDLPVGETPEPSTARTPGPFVSPFRHHARPRGMDDPLPTIVASSGSGGMSIVTPTAEPFTMANRANNVPRSIDEPAATMTTAPGGGGLYVVEPTTSPAPVDVDPRRVVLIDGVPHLLDIRFRMLSNRELARAMGFDDDEVEYEFTGNVGEVTRQIGNAVSVATAAALVRSILVVEPC